MHYALSMLMSFKIVCLPSLNTLFRNFSMHQKKILSALKDRFPFETRKVRLFIYTIQLSNRFASFFTIIFAMDVCDIMLAIFWNMLLFSHCNLPLRTIMRCLSPHKYACVALSFLLFRASLSQTLKSALALAFVWLGQNMNFIFHSGRLKSQISIASKLRRW